MNIKDYEYVAEIWTQGNISRAAERLCITPGALTKYLKRLEEQLNTPLFYRLGNRCLLTTSGKAYIEKGREIIRLDRELQDELSGIRERGEMALRFGVPRSLNIFAIEQLFPDFYGRKQFACVRYTEDSSNALIDSVANGKLDICLAYAGERRPGLLYDRVGQTEMALAVPYFSELIRKAGQRSGYQFPVLETDEWLSEPYISISTLTKSGKSAVEYFKQINRHPSVRLYVEDTKTALAAVEKGIGNSLLAAMPYTDQMVKYLILPDMKQEPRDIYLVTRKNSYQSDSMQELIRLIREKCSLIWK